MKQRLALLILFSFFATAAVQAQQREYIILVGGPSLHQWEQYKARPHDHWWANFVRSGRVRSEQLRAERGADTLITWLVYKPGYVERGKQDNQDLISHINSVRDKYNLKLVYFDRGEEVINYLNGGMPRDQVKISGLEYFGHSNKACFLFDYSNIVDSASKSWLHETELKRINRRAFARDAFVKSWGCHTGESMSKYWREALGIKMWGAIGKTDYSTAHIPVLSSAGGKWVF